MKKIALLLSMLLVSLNIKAVAIAKPPSVNAAGCVLMDLNSGDVIYKKNYHGRYAPASTTKVMTALITLEKCKLTDKVTVSKNPQFEDGSKIYLLEGEQVTVEQLLYALLLESANDSAVALAEHISGSKAAFAKLMTERAKELGCKDTNFTNLNGLYDKAHYTSAYDLTLITEKAMENPTFRKIVSTVSFNLLPTNKQKQTRFLHNHNKLLFYKGDKYQGADGVKTGYTVKSKHTYVGSATRNGRTLIAVFLYDDKTFYKETAALFNYGFNNFKNKKVYSKTTAIAKLKLKGDNQQISVYPEKDVYVTVPIDSNPNVKTNITLNKTLTKVTKDEIVGSVNLTDDAKDFNVNVNLISSENYTASQSMLPTVNKSVKSIFRLSNIKYLFILALAAFLTRGFYRKYKRLKGIKEI